MRTRSWARAGEMKTQSRSRSSATTHKNRSLRAAPGGPGGTPLRCPCRIQLEIITPLGASLDREFGEQTVNVGELAGLWEGRPGCGCPYLRGAIVAGDAFESQDIRSPGGPSVRAGWFQRGAVAGPLR